MGENKKMEDYLVVATALNGHIRLLALRSEKLLNDFVKVHDLSPVAIQIAGKVAMGSLLLAKGLKGEKSSLTCTLKSDGDFSGMTVHTNTKGQIRGFVKNPHIPSYRSEKGGLDPKQALGSNGILTIIKDYGLKEPYIGQVEIPENKDIASAFALYLAKSEQINSFISLGLMLNAEGVMYAGGLMVQVMPDITEEELDYLEKRAYGGFPEISYLLAEGFTPSQIIDMFIGDPNIKYLDKEEVTYFCPCNLELMKEKLLLLGKKDLEELASDPKGIQIECHFCNTKYHLQQTEINKILDEV